MKRMLCWLLLMPLAGLRVWGDFVAEGTASYQQHDWDGAITNYTKAIEQNPASFVAYYDRGMAKKAKQDLDGAIADYNKAIELRADHPNYYLNRGNAKAAKGDAAGAIADYNQTIELKPDFWQAYLNRANAKCQADGLVDSWETPLVSAEAVAKLESALADYSKAIEINPGLTEAYFSRGYLRYLQGRLDQADAKSTQTKDNWDGALADFSKIIELQPTNANAFCLRGIIKTAQGETESGLADYSQAIELDPANVRALVNRALARIARHDLDGALADFNQAKALQPGDGQTAQINLGLSQIYCAHARDKWLKDDADGALADLNQAIELNPANAESYRNRGIIEQRKHAYQSAEADYTKALELAPGDSALQESLDKVKKYLKEK
jgi:tetratricopeptide (TPR) repeat protein